MTLSAWTYAPAVAPDALGDLQYHELKDTGRESISLGNSDVVRVFLVKWTRRAAFLDDLLGWAQQDVIPDGLVLRVLPDPHPNFDLFYASSATVEGMGILGNSGGAATFTVAKITCSYKPVTYSILADSLTNTNELYRYVTRSFTYASEMMTTYGRMQFVSRANQQFLEYKPTRVIGTIEATYIWHQVPALGSDVWTCPNINTILEATGKVNSQLFDNYPAGTGYAAGTVLFLGAEPRMVTPALGQDWHYWEIAMKFLIRDNGPAIAGDPYDGRAGHNYIFDSAQNPGRWDLITNNGSQTGQRLYEYYDLNSLFTCDIV